MEPMRKMDIISETGFIRRGRVISSYVVVRAGVGRSVEVQGNRATMPVARGIAYESISTLVDPWYDKIDKIEA